MLTRTYKIEAETAAKQLTSGQGIHQRGGMVVVVVVVVLALQIGTMHFAIRLITSGVGAIISSRLLSEPWEEEKRREEISATSAPSPWATLYVTIPLYSVQYNAVQHTVQCHCMEYSTIHALNIDRCYLQQVTCSPVPKFRRRPSSPRADPQSFI